MEDRGAVANTQIYVCLGERLVYDIFEWKIVGRNLFALFMTGIGFFILNVLIEYNFFIKWRSVEAGISVRT